MLLSKIVLYVTRKKIFPTRDILVFYICCCSVAQSCLTLCDPMDSSTPDFPVFHYYEFAQTHVHWVGDAIQPPHPLSSPSPPALKLSQHQGLFQWVNFLHQVTKVLEFQLPASFLPMNIQGWFPLGLIGLISLLSKRLSRVFSSTTIWKHQFSGAQPLEPSCIYTSLDSNHKHLNHVFYELLRTHNNLLNIYFTCL